MVHHSRNKVHVCYHLSTKKEVHLFKVLSIFFHSGTSVLAASFAETLVEATSLNEGAEKESIVLSGLTAPALHRYGWYGFNRTTFEVQPRPQIQIELNLVIVIRTAPH